MWKVEMTGGAAIETLSSLNINSMESSSSGFGCSASWWEDFRMLAWLVYPDAKSWSVTSSDVGIKGVLLWIVWFLVEMRVDTTWDRVSFRCLVWALLTKCSQFGSSVHGCPLPEPGTRPVVASEIGGTAPASESLGYEKGVSNCTCAEEEWIFKMTRKCVPMGCKELFSSPTSPCWESEGGLCGDSPWVCERGFETPKDTLE